MSACRHPIATSAGKAHAGSALSMTPADPAPIVHGHVCPPTVGSMAMRRQLPGGAEMQGNAYQPTTWRRETLGIAACVSLVLSGCGGGKSADVTLPIDPVEDRKSTGLNSSH